MVEVCGQGSVLYDLASEVRPPGRFLMSLLLSAIGLTSVKEVNIVRSDDVGRSGYLLRQLLG